jgi:hypothetical protein
MKAGRSMNVRRLMTALVLCLLAAALPAGAVLGGDLASVGIDQATMQARLQSSSAGSYTLHEMSAPTGTKVREYVSSAGKVFAVAWRGPAIPNLRQLLGPYFDRYQQAARAYKAQHRGRGPMLVRADGLVVQTAGHARAFSGRAYAPDMVPSGVSINEIQ